jgi:hypothetical protein
MTAVLLSLGQTRVKALILCMKCAGRALMFLWGSEAVNTRVAKGMRSQLGRDLNRWEGRFYRLDSGNCQSGEASMLLKTQVSCHIDSGFRVEMKGERRLDEGPPRRKIRRQSNCSTCC